MMAKVTMPAWRDDMSAILRTMGIDSSCVARVVIDMQPGMFAPTMHVEMIGDARIIDLGAVLAGVDDVRVSRSETPRLVFRVVATRSDLPGSDRGA